MAWSANSNQKVCATCANWGGPREVNCFRDKVTTPGNICPNGKCYINPTVGGFANGPKADWGCPKHTKWSQLK